MTVFLNNIPEDLQKVNNWVLWNKDDNSKNPLQLNGSNAKTNDSTTWTDFNSVKDFIEKYKNDGYGPGFVFTKEIGYVGIDFDHVVENRVIIDEKVKNLVDIFGSYTEISPSGKGLHSIIKSKLPKNATHRLDKYHMEIYDNVRYFRLTGDLYNGFKPIREIDPDTLNVLFEEKKQYEHKIEEQGLQQGLQFDEKDKELLEEWLNKNWDLDKPENEGNHHQVALTFLVDAKEEGFDLTSVKEFLINYNASHPCKDGITHPENDLLKLIDYVYVQGYQKEAPPGSVSEEQKKEIRAVFKKIKIPGNINQNDKEIDKIIANLHPIMWFDVDKNGTDKKFNLQRACDDFLNACPHILTEYNGIIHIHTSRGYLKDSDNFIKSMFEKAGHIAPELLNRVVEYIRNYTLHSNPESIEKPFDIIYSLPEHLIPIEDGLLNINNKTIIPHDPNYFYVSHIPRKYIPGAKAEHFREFLNILFTDDLDKDTKITQIYEIFAWILSPEYIPHGVVFLLGSGGEGKSIIHKILENFVGETSAVSIKELENDKFKRAELYGKYANIVSEAGGGLVKSEWFKKTSDGTKIIADRKNGQPFYFSSRAKWIVDTNKLPMLNDDSIAFYRRVIAIISFENYLENLLTPERIDSYIKEILDSEELDRLFSEVVDDYYTPFRKRLKFTNQYTLDEAQENYQKFVNPANAYIEDRIDNEAILTDIEEVKKYLKDNELSDELFISKDQKKSNEYLTLIKRFVELDAKAWARDQKLPVDLINTKSLGNALDKHGFPNISINKKIEASKIKTWKDIFIILKNINIYRATKTVGDLTKHGGTLDKYLTETGLKDEVHNPQNPSVPDELKTENFAGTGLKDEVDNPMTPSVPEASLTPPENIENNKGEKKNKEPSGTQVVSSISHTPFNPVPAKNTKTGSSGTDPQEKPDAMTEKDAEEILDDLKAEGLTIDSESGVSISKDYYKIGIKRDSLHDINKIKEKMQSYKFEMIAENDKLNLYWFRRPLKTEQSQAQGGQ